MRAAPRDALEATALRDLAGVAAAPCFSNPPQPGDCLYVGLTVAAPRGVILLRIDCTIEGIGVDPDRPPLRWEAATPRGWVRCEVETDGTG